MNTYLVIHKSGVIHEVEAENISSATYCKDDFNEKSIIGVILKSHAHKVSLSIMLNIEPINTHSSHY